MEHALLLYHFTACGVGENTAFIRVGAHVPLTVPPLLQLSKIFLQSSVVVRCHYDYEVVEDGVVGEEIGQRSDPVGQIIDVHKE